MVTREPVARATERACTCRCIGRWEGNLVVIRAHGPASALMTTLPFVTASMSLRYPPRRSAGSARGKRVSSGTAKRVHPRGFVCSRCQLGSPRRQGFVHMRTRGGAQPRVLSYAASRPRRRSLGPGSSGQANPIAAAAGGLVDVQAAATHLGHPHYGWSSATQRCRVRLPTYLGEEPGSTSLC
jgi:hypothetical protein